MKTKSYLLSVFFILLTVIGCQTDDTVGTQPFVAAFGNPSYDYSKIENEQLIKIVFSDKTQQAGSVVIKVSAANAEYGVDFTTFPSAESGSLTLSFEAGITEKTFTLKNLVFPFVTGDDDKSILFEVTAINYPLASNIQGYTKSLVSFQRSLGTVTQPEVGGPNQGDQVYVDLSTETVTKVRRDSWDLGFYGGEDFRVVLNGSVYMAAKELETTDIDAVTQSSVQQYQTQVAVGTFDPTNINYIDAPNGDITQTAISQISATAGDNKVYLVNLGYTVGTTIPAAGSVAIAGDARGWKKIRILRSGTDYVLQYADLTSATHQEITISKNEAYNFTFFSFNTQSVVNVEPEKNKWDLNFTVFTNEIVGSGSYGYSDFVLNNLKAGVKVYRVTNSGGTQGINFNTYMLKDVQESSFVNDQRVIGAEWRDVFSGSAFTDRFYVIKDVDNNYYKIRMLAFLDESGVRGYPKFEYKLLQ